MVANFKSIKNILCFSVGSFLYTSSVVVAEVDNCSFLENKIENISVEYVLSIKGDMDGERIKSKMNINYFGMSSNFQYFFNYYTSIYINMQCDLSKLVEIERKIPQLRVSGEGLLFNDYFDEVNNTYNFEKDAKIIEEVSAFGLELAGVIQEYNTDGDITLYGYKTTKFNGVDSSGIFKYFNAAVIPTTKVVSGIYARSEAYKNVDECESTADTIANKLLEKYGDKANNVISVSSTRAGDLHAWIFGDFQINLECRSDNIFDDKFVDIRYVNVGLIDLFKEENLKIISGDIRLDDF